MADPASSMKLPDGFSASFLSRLAAAGCIDDAHRSSSSSLLQLLPSQGGSHPPTVTTKETESLLASEFKNLSVQEQAKAMNDLHHASGSVLVEDPLVINKLLQDFEQEVGRTKSQIYDLALSQDRSYVEDPAFQLLFLRANLHDVKRATKQMMSFLRHKATYFGAHKVASDITIDDLTPEELRLMLSGIFHIQDGTDRNGRVILHYFSKPLPNKLNPESIMRVCYFIWFNILIPIHSVQMKGLVAITYDLSKPTEKIKSPMSLRNMMRCMDGMSSFPIRYTANHLCFKRVEGSISWNNVLFGLSLRALPKDVRERSRVHYGSDTELQYELTQDFGIPLENFPVDADGNLRTNILNTWFHKYLETNGVVAEELYDEGASSLSDNDDMEEDHHHHVYSSVSSRAARANNAAAAAAGGGNGNNNNQGPPAPNTVTDGIWETDVLLGRGRLVQYHPGNVHFRDFLDEHIQDYESLARNQRRRACSDLARELISSGTRFLKQTETDLWVVCEFEECVDKVAQFYRTRRRRDNNRAA